MEPVEYPIVPPGKWTFLVPAIAIFGSILLLVVVLTLAKAPQEQWLNAWPAFAAMLIVPFVLWRAGHRSVWLVDEGLRIRTVPWPRTLALGGIDLEQARIVRLDPHGELWPTVKIAGSRMPGYRSGRFRLRDGRYASVIVSELERVLYLPLRDGKVVLLSVERGDSLLDAMRRRASLDARRRG